jgi:hypothetical protein
VEEWLTDYAAQRGDLGIADTPREVVDLGLASQRLRNIHKEVRANYAMGT